MNTSEENKIMETIYIISTIWAMITIVCQLTYFLISKRKVEKEISDAKVYYHNLKRKLINDVDIYEKDREQIERLIIAVEKIANNEETK